jgi:Lon protease-like protein
MLPGEEKTLHLFEARYLALFDDAVLNYDRRFGHILLSTERSSLAASGALVYVSDWERLDIGVKLRIHGIGRIQVASVELDSSAPYILGSVSCLHDTDEHEDGEVPVSQILTLEESFWKEALRLIDVSVDLGLSPFRSKKHVTPPTIDGDAFGSAGSSSRPPPEHTDAAAKKVPS